VQNLESALLQDNYSRTLHFATSSSNEHMPKNDNKKKAEGSLTSGSGACALAPHETTQSTVSNSTHPTRFVFIRPSSADITVDSAQEEEFRHAWLEARNKHNAVLFTEAPQSIDDPVDSDESGLDDEPGDIDDDGAEPSDVDEADEPVEEEEQTSDDGDEGGEDNNEDHEEDELPEEDTIILDGFVARYSPRQALEWLEQLPQRAREWRSKERQRRRQDDDIEEKNNGDAPRTTSRYIDPPRPAPISRDIIERIITSALDKVSETVESAWTPGMRTFPSFITYIFQGKAQFCEDTNQPEPHGQGVFHYPDGSTTWCEHVEMGDFSQSAQISHAASEDDPDGDVSGVMVLSRPLRVMVHKSCNKPKRLAKSQGQEEVETVQFALEFSGPNRLIFAGYVKDGIIRHGPGAVVVDDGTMLAGTWCDGRFTGYNNVWYYNAANPNEGGYRGKWVDLKMREGRFFSERTGLTNEVFMYEGPGANRIARNPLQAEPWEQERVFVAPSRLEMITTQEEVITSSPQNKRVKLDNDADQKCNETSFSPGEGLFARRDLAKGELVSFYSGSRPSSRLVDRRSWDLNSNAITIKDNGRTCVDVPSPYDSTKFYTASLCHKANHTFDPSRVNCAMGLFWHPRFGFIKAMRTIQPVKAGDELLVDYGYERKLQFGPKWFRAGLREWRRKCELDSSLPPQAWKEPGITFCPQPELPDLRELDLSYLPLPVQLELETTWRDKWLARE